MNDMNNIISFDRKKNQFEYLRENCFNLVANLLTEADIRNQFSEDKFTQILENTIIKIAQYDLAYNPLYIKPAEAALGVLANVSYQCNE